MSGGHEKLRTFGHEKSGEVAVRCPHASLKNPLEGYLRPIMVAVLPTGHEKLVGLPRACDPNGDVATVWEAKEAVHELDAPADPDVALEWVTQLGRDLQDKDYPIEARSLGVTLIHCRH